MPFYQLGEITLEIPSEHLGARVEAALERGSFERDEARALARHFTPADRLLDLGAGTGYMASIAGRIAGGQAVTGVEALPAMVEVARANLLRNGVEGAQIHWGAVVPDAYCDAQVRFAARRQFWASGILRAQDTRYRAALDVPALRLGPLLHETQATVLSCDIEGGEQDLFEADLPEGLRLVILEIHPRRYGDSGTAQVFATLLRNRMVYCSRGSVGTTLVFRRIGTEP